METGFDVLFYGPDSLYALVSQRKDLQPLIFIGGLGDELFQPGYVRELFSHYRLILPRFHTTGNSFGLFSLSQDAKDLNDLLDELKGIDINKPILMGFSTGCQSILRYLEVYNNGFSCTGKVILQGAVSDQQCFMKDEAANRLHCFLDKNPEYILPEPFFGAPVTVERLRSLLIFEGEDDFFSTGSQFCVERCRKALSNVDHLFVMGEKDECIDSLHEWKHMIDLIQKQSYVIIPNGGHSLRGCLETLIRVISDFLAK